MFVNKRFFAGLFFISATLYKTLAAAQTCNLVFDKCPGDFTAGTLTVPKNIIWLDPKIPFCQENVPVQTGTTQAVPSIVFIIDNSGSMGDDPLKSDATDPETARFTKTSDLLDSIYKSDPSTEVGLVIFSRRLVSVKRGGA